MLGGIHALRHYDVTFDTSGAVSVSRTALYQGSYGFVLLRCFVPVTQNHTVETTPCVDVFKTVIDETGKTVTDDTAYPLQYVEETVLNSGRYFVFEGYMPKSFTDTVGSLSMTFSYYEATLYTENGVQKVKSTCILYSSTVVEDVRSGGKTASVLNLPQGAEWIAKVNQNSVAINALSVNLKPVSTTLAGKDENGGSIYQITFGNGSTIDFTVPQGERGPQGKQGETGATGAKIVSTELQGQDENGNNIYLQTFDDGTTATFIAPRGPTGSGTQVTVGGEVQETFDADTKLNKLSPTYEFIYAQTSTGKVNDKPFYYNIGAGTSEQKNVNGSVPVYNGQNLYSGIPTKPYQSANMKFVEDSIETAVENISSGGATWKKATITEDGGRWQLPEIEVGKQYVLSIIMQNIATADLMECHLVDGSGTDLIGENFWGCTNVTYYRDDIQYNFGQEYTPIEYYAMNYGEDGYERNLNKYLVYGGFRGETLYLTVPQTYGNEVGIIYKLEEVTAE